MIKKTVIWACAFVFVPAFAFPAFADQSIGFRQYFEEGVQAFKEHDDQKALRCFKIAQIYDPSDKELNAYLEALEEKGVTLEQGPASLPSADSIGYRYYLSKGIKAIKEHDNIKAIHYFNIAIIFYPDSQEADQYLQNLAQPLAVAPPAALYVAAPKPNAPAPVILLSQITNNGQAKPKMQIELNSSVILEGRNIQRFLIVDEGFIVVKIINADQLELDARKIGTTFLHIWDALGRHTLYIEVVFPPSVINGNALLATNGVQHAQPFVATYSNDWSTYNSGKNIPNLKRQSYQFNQSLGVRGETPYGFFDASGSYIDYGTTSEFDSYTMGLSQIPLEGTSDFNLRGFDALRYLSPLTMPGTQLRGEFADVDLMGDALGLSVSHGQEAEQQYENFTAIGQPQFYNAYIDAAKLTLFPKSDSDRYSFNFATGYGPQRPVDESNHVYSLQGQHKFNDYLTLNGEAASDTNHDASLASLKWQEGTFKTGLNFRDISKNFATVSGLPSNQGELGAAWTTDGDFKNFSESTFLEAYRDRLDYNPNDQGAYNYDGNGHLRTNMSQSMWSDTEFNFVDTQGELSPEQSFELNERLSKSFGIWDSLKGTVFGGTGYQNSHSSQSDISDYHREDVIAGIQLPLTDQISTFANYEYDWLDQPYSGGNSNPSVINAGFEYQKQVNPKFSINSQLEYRDELGVSPNSSFLSGEESILITSGFSYNPTPDVSIFADGDASKILSHTGNPSYDDFEVHVGLRITFGGAMYWDPLGTVSGIVFKDRTQDGKFDSRDEGIPGIKLKVGDKQVTTDKYGRYSVQIRAKGVDVVPVLDTIPGGLIFSTPQLVHVDIHQGVTRRADFGLISQTGIYGIIFVDKNGSGVPNDNDKFVGKVKVVLDGKTIQRSDPHGAFYFRQVSPGEHTISLDINTLALNMVPLIKLKNKIDVAEGTNYMFNIPVQIKKAEDDQN